MMVNFISVQIWVQIFYYSTEGLPDGIGGGGRSGLEGGHS